MTDSPLPWSHAALIGLIGGLLITFLWLLTLPAERLTAFMDWVF